MEISKKTSFITGEIVVAKLKGYPHWPAKITEIQTNDKNHSQKYKVVFFGDKNCADIKESDIYCYEQYKNLYGQPKIDHFKNKLFNKALKEAENAYKQHCMEVTGKEEIFESDPDDPVSDTGSLNSLSTGNNTTLTYLESSILENDLTNKEDKLKMAATVGTALLKENQSLKCQIAILENKVASSEAMIEEMKEEERKHLKIIENLLASNSAEPPAATNAPQDAISHQRGTVDEAGLGYISKPEPSVKKPPITALIRLDTENLEDFFTNHVDIYKKINEHYRIGYVAHFLEACHLKKFKEKSSKEA
ncbi:hepatoma-derived growth factor- protein [Homalodisca vitripennis]|nr:hepatoma-derived growth factor- protein [Homalodisca vitripennis]